MSEDAQARQRDVISRWEEAGFRCESTYDSRLRRMIASALGLWAYRGLWSERRGLVGAHLDGRDGIGYRDLLVGLPAIGKTEARSVNSEALALRSEQFSSYFETSGTTALPMPTPKSQIDITVNTVNFGEHWRRFVGARRVAIILINTPQGPAAFQFERALNYLGMMTIRTWVDTFRNDYARVLDIVGELKPDVYAGPPSQLLNLYEFAAISGRPAPRFELCLLTGERTTPGLRRRLELLSGGEIVDSSYGSSETGITAVAAGEGRGRMEPRRPHHVRRGDSARFPGSGASGARGIPGAARDGHRLGNCAHLPMWNCVGAINAANALGLGRYRDFCLGRAQVFDDLGWRSGALPAATGIGFAGGGVSIYLLASKSFDVDHWEKPLQTAAYDYPAMYGPRAPLFARATSAGTGCQQTVCIAGTANVRGHSTVGETVAEQLTITIEIIDAIVDRARRANPSSRAGVDSLKVYVRHEEDIAAVTDVLRGHTTSRRCRLRSCVPIFAETICYWRWKGSSDPRRCPHHERTSDHVRVGGVRTPHRIRDQYPGRSAAASRGVRPAG